MPTCKLRGTGTISFVYNKISKQLTINVRLYVTSFDDNKNDLVVAKITNKEILSAMMRATIGSADQFNFWGSQEWDSSPNLKFVLWNRPANMGELIIKIPNNKNIGNYPFASTVINLK